MFIADILCTDVSEEITDKDGKLRLDKAGLMAFAHGEYFELGKKIGTFGYSAKKKGRSSASGKKSESTKQHKKDSKEKKYISDNRPKKGKKKS